MTDWQTSTDSGLSMADINTLTTAREALTDISLAVCPFTCHPICLTCKTSSMNDCLTCKPNASVNTDGMCVCADGYFQNLGSGNCVQCDSACRTCSDLGPSMCTGCKSISTLTSTPGTCVCPSAYYEDPSHMCIACDPTCLTCSGTGPSMCLSCKSTAALSGSPGTCSCATGLFMNATGVCGACDVTCKTCSAAAANMCTACKSTGVLSATPGTCTCPDSFFFSLSTQVCVACDQSCLTCSGPSASNCKSCKAFSTLTNGLCVCNPGACACPPGQYFSLVAGACTPCDPSCQTCSGAGPSLCTLCTSGLALSQTPGSCTCSAGLYFKVSLLICAPCDPSCKTCSAADMNSCTSCKSTASMNGALLGPCLCSDQFYMNSGTCLPCYPKCSKCTGPSQAECTKTASSSFLDTLKAVDPSLPYLTPTSSLLCYRTPLPTDCAMSPFTYAEPTLSSDPTKWTLTSSNCDTVASFEYPSIDTAYTKLFAGLAVPNADLGKVATVKAILKLWVSQFGYHALLKRADWKNFVGFLVSIPAAQWTNVAGYSGTGKYFDGSATKDLPADLKAWLALGYKDVDFMNYWNGVGAVCMLGTCSDTEAAVCCSAGISCGSLCCVTRPTMKTGACVA